MKEGFLKLFSFFAFCFLVLFLACLAPISHGLVLRVFWGWFVVPFFGLPNLPLFLAAGIAVLIRFLVAKPFFTVGPSDKKSEESMAGFRPSDVESAGDLWRGFGKMFNAAIYSAVLIPAAAIFTGWIFHFFI
jgi:hypothetical protein